MPNNDAQPPDFDWRVTTFEGSRREQLRQWSQLPLEQILLAIEEMEEMNRWLAPSPGQDGESIGKNKIRRSQEIPDRELMESKARKFK